MLFRSIIITTVNPLGSLAALLCIAVFSCLCVRESSSFSTTTDHARWRRSIAGDSFSHRAKSALSPPSSCTKSLSPSLLPSSSASSSPSRLASTVVDNPTTIEKIVEEKKKISDKEENEAKNSGKDEWEIQLFNDPYNRRNFVARCLCQICGKSDVDSYQIMMKAHNDG